MKAATLETVRAASVADRGGPVRSPVLLRLAGKVKASKFRARAVYLDGFRFPLAQNFAFATVLDPETRAPLLSVQRHAIGVTTR